MEQDKTIKNLIFDLGGVILDLSIDHTLQAFAGLSGVDKKKIDQLYATSPEFLDFEMGMMTDDEFRTFVRKVYSITCSVEDLDTSWNAMLRGLPLIKLQLIENLKKKYSVFLLSNTNSIHLKYINETLLRSTAPNALSLDDYFHKAYYSHVMKKRKPHVDIFEQVLMENDLVPSETLFLDDNADNIEGAKLAGIKTAFVNTPDFILKYFHES